MGGPASGNFEALGCLAVVVVADGAGLDAAQAVVRQVVDEFDRACSRFREDSELTAVNRGAGAPVPVGATLREATQAALRAARLTGGAVDPTVGEALVALGYDRDFAALPERSPQPRIVSAPGWQTVQVDATAGTIRIPSGVRLDLGASAKALCADVAAAGASAKAGCGVLVSLGGDIATAGPAPDGGWSVRVTDDHRAGPEAPGQWIRMRSGGLATSSTAVRRWRAGSEIVHHVVDPSTGRPVAGPWRTVSVTAASCLEANTAATAAIVRGEPALAWLEELGLPSRLVPQSGAAVHLAGWPQAHDDLGVAA